MLIAIFVGIIGAAVCHEIASERNRSVPFWTILGFFFAPLAIILIATLPRLAAEYQICNKCGADLQLTAKERRAGEFICPDCGFANSVTKTEDVQSPAGS